jgi:hypothetical protein
MESSRPATPERGAHVSSIKAKRTIGRAAKSSAAGSRQMNKNAIMKVLRRSSWAIVK